MKRTGIEILMLNTFMLPSFSLVQQTFPEHLLTVQHTPRPRGGKEKIEVSLKKLLFSGRPMNTPVG